MLFGYLPNFGVGPILIGTSSKVPNNPKQEQQGKAERLKVTRFSQADTNVFSCASGAIANHFGPLTDLFWFVSFKSESVQTQGTNQKRAIGTAM